MLVETAAAMVKMMKSRLHEWYSGNRPNISDKGAMTITLVEVQLQYSIARTEWTKAEAKNID